MNKGQTMVEYVIILGIVIAAAYAMGPALKRGAQTVVKASADQLAVQNTSDQDFGTSEGHLVESNSATQLSSRRDIEEQNGTTTTTEVQATRSNIASKTTMGFQQ